MRPGWLPDTLTLNSSSVEEDYKKLYAVFEKDFVESRPFFKEQEVFYETALDRQDPRYPHGFIHLVTKDDGNGQRFIDYNRACRLPWVRAVIDNCKEPEVSVFCAQQASRNYGIVDIYVSLA